MSKSETSTKVGFHLDNFFIHITITIYESFNVNQTIQSPYPSALDFWHSLVWNFTNYSGQKNSVQINKKSSSSNSIFQTRECQKSRLSHFFLFKINIFVFSYKRIDWKTVIVIRIKQLNEKTLPLAIISLIFHLANAQTLFYLLPKEICYSHFSNISVMGLFS